MPLKVFISYAHKDKLLKDALLEHLSGLRRRGLIQPWDDSVIEVGSDWRAAISTALNNCDIALLLVSSSFLASEFIHSIELEHLLERRKKENLRIVPILLRPCNWKSEKISDFQALPECGKTITEFSAEAGEQDGAWAQIAGQLESWAKEIREHSRRYPRTKMTPADRYEEFLAMASSHKPEWRDLAARKMAQFYDEDPNDANTLLKKALEEDSAKVQRTALKTAYYLGQSSQEIFMWIAQSNLPQLRQEAKDTVYLSWERDPSFVYDLLHALLGQLNFKPVELTVPKSRNRLLNTIKFFLELTITIYINHCDRDDVAKTTAELYYKLSTEKLGLHKLNKLLNKGILGPYYEKLMLWPVNVAFSKSILNILLYADLEPLELFFDAPPEKRACLNRVAPALDPRFDLGSVEGDLPMMLESDIAFLNHSAALAIAVHAYQDFPNTQLLVRRLFDQLGGHGRLWMLFSFSVLLRETPASWTELLEELTERLIRENPRTFYDNSFLLGRYDMIFLPLGLAYGKRGISMSLFYKLIGEGFKIRDELLTKRCILALGPVGFYYPKAVLSTLQESISDFNDSNLRDALVRPLAIMQTLHFDEVDQFIKNMIGDENFQRRVWAAADVPLVQGYISCLGHYNNAVHQSIFYPKMREAFTIGAIHILADARQPKEFIHYYTRTAFKMAHEADFDLMKWTHSE